MIRAGFESTNPVTQSRTVVIKGADETGGRGWLIEIHCKEGTPPDIAEHFHLTWTETFEIVQGSATCKVGGVERAMRAGERIVMPPGVPHVHPWNTGSGDMIYHQSSDFGEVKPSAVNDVLGAFATIHGLAREGKIGKNRLPKHPLQLAATLRTLTKYGGYDANVPVWVQRAVSATVGGLAEVLGYRGVYPRYLRRE